MARNRRNGEPWLGLFGSWAVLAASAERMPPAQWKMNFLSCWKIGLA
jgi:hypothetical protein